MCGLIEVNIHNYDKYIEFSGIFPYNSSMQNRRKFLQGLAATAFGSALTPGMAEAAPKSAHPDLVKNATALLKKSDVLIFADCDHTNLGLRAPLNDRPTMKKFRAADVTELYLEFPKQFDECARNMALGNMRRKDFVGTVLFKMNEAIKEIEGKAATDERLEQIAILADCVAENVITAKNAGINVYCVDPNNCTEQIRLVNELDRTGDKSGLRDRVMKHDPEVAQFIKKTTQKKALVMYGNLHSVLSMPIEEKSGLPGNIDDALRALGKKTSLILLTENVGDMKSYYDKLRGNPQSLPLLDFGKGVDVPDYAYDPIARKGTSLTPGTIAMMAKPMTAQLGR
ncbi:MAG: hypothetical protein DI626_03845 [Micavibrio aeruginosavorus]|uniref:Haem-binding uptake Tiki superfamily ChaN domain-containing protein n=1 Tax=Micavibrio aeruginosavorus TaxID=349221 RepID=A0A2W4ZYZ2_9BACT|nr:MAG: hypothetical protein DI626_03845 [Micavibrio aeruginosavorus]